MRSILGALFTGVIALAVACAGPGELPTPKFSTDFPVIRPSTPEQTFTPPPSTGQGEQQPVKSPAPMESDGAERLPEIAATTITLPNGEARILELGSEHTPPEVGEVVTAFTGPPEASGNPAATGLVTAAEVQTRLEGFLDEITANSGGPLDQAEPQARERAAVLAEILGNHATHNVTILQHMVDNEFLPAAAMPAVGIAIAAAEAGRTHALGVIQQLDSQGGPPGVGQAPPVDLPVSPSGEPEATGAEGGKAAPPDLPSTPPQGAGTPEKTQGGDGGSGSNPTGKGSAPSAGGGGQGSSNAGGSGSGSGPGGGGGSP